MKHLKLIGSLLIVAGLVLAGCGGGAQAKGTIKIATQSPLSAASLCSASTSRTARSSGWSSWAAR
jgi:hypothetical protein